MDGSPVNKAPRVKLKPNLRKILAAIAYLIAMSEKRGTAISQYQILKSLFLADRAHLNSYGRPVTYDNYHAMRAGPVPSVAYELLKESSVVMKRNRIKHLPWERHPAGAGRFDYSRADTRDVDSALSESDKGCLENALAAIKGLSFSQIVRLTHADPAYVEAWEQNGEHKSYLMSYGMLFDAPNYEAAERVEFLSKHT